MKTYTQQQVDELLDRQAAETTALLMKRYNNYDDMKEACEALIELRDFIANHHGDDSDETPILDRALEAIQNLPSLK